MNTEFKESFIYLGLEQYLPIFAQSGFNDWPSLCAVTESDLTLLGLKRGHRRKLQREIARRHAWPDDKPLPAGGLGCCACLVVRWQGPETVNDSTSDGPKSTRKEEISEASGL